MQVTIGGGPSDVDQNWIKKYNSRARQLWLPQWLEKRYRCRQECTTWIIQRSKDFAVSLDIASGATFGYCYPSFTLTWLLINTTSRKSTTNTEMVEEVLIMYLLRRRPRWQWSNSQNVLSLLKFLPHVLQSSHFNFWLHCPFTHSFVRLSIVEPLLCFILHYLSSSDPWPGGQRLTCSRILQRHHGSISGAKGQSEVSGSCFYEKHKHVPGGYFSLILKLRRRGGQKSYFFIRWLQRRPTRVKVPYVITWLGYLGEFVIKYAFCGPSWHHLFEFGWGLILCLANVYVKKTENIQGKSPSFTSPSFKCLW